MDVLVKNGRKKVVGASCVYNEEHIIGYWLEQLEDIVDEIVVVDDGSTDRTVQILRRSLKVKEVVVQPPMKQTGYAPREHINRNILFRLARKRGAHWIIYLDADEIFSYNIRDIIPDLVQRDDVVQYTFIKVWLWRCEHLYRVDKPQKYLKPAEWRFMRNLRTLRWVSEAETSGRLRYLLKRFLGILGDPGVFSGAAVLTGLSGRTQLVDDVVILHYACVNMEKEVKKRMKYAVGRRFLYRKKSLDQICDEVYSVIDENGLRLKAVDLRWFPPSRRDEIKRYIEGRFFPMTCFSSDYRQVPVIDWG